MRSARLIYVGKTRLPFWRDAADHYIKRLAPWCKMEEVVLKDSTLPPEKRAEYEGHSILDCLGPQEKTSALICLDETGKTYTSKAFAEFLEQIHTTYGRPTFIIGGPFGLSKAVKDRAGHKLAFGPQTITHEMARVLLLEQLYRAEAILHGSPYHHG